MARAGRATAGPAMSAKYPRDIPYAIPRFSPKIVCSSAWTISEGARKGAVGALSKPIPPHTFPQFISLSLVERASSLVVALFRNHHVRHELSEYVSRHGEGPKIPSVNGLSDPTPCGRDIPSAQRRRRTGDSPSGSKPEGKTESPNDSGRYPDGHPPQEGEEKINKHDSREQQRIEDFPRYIPESNFAR